MKNSSKKIVIIVLNAIAIALNMFSIFSLLMVNLFSTQIEEYKKLIENVNIVPQVIIISICIILSILSIIFSVKIEKNKTKVGLCLLISTMIGSLYNIIVGFISIIILYRKSSEEKETLIPELPEIKNKIITRILFLLLFVILFLFLYVGVFNDIIGNLITKWNFILRIIFIYSLQVSLTVLPLIKNIIRDAKAFIKNRKVYFAEMVKTISYMILFYIPISLIIKLIVGETSTNQNTLQGLPIVFMIIVGVFIAPLCEELMFRGFLRKVFKNETVFIIISSIVFGIIHCMYAETNLLLYLYVVPYAIIGAGLAKVYAKTDNLWTNIFMHMGWNAIAFASMVLIGA